MAINNVILQYNGGLFPDIILLTQCYYHNRGSRLNAMKRFCLCMIPPKHFDIFPLTGECSEGLDAFRFFFKQQLVAVVLYWYAVPLYVLLRSTYYCMQQ